MIACRRRGADVSTTHFGTFRRQPLDLSPTNIINFVRCLISVAVILLLYNVRSNA